jgi:ATP/maltotriose-dependent transcriptional regulator MalT
MLGQAELAFDRGDMRHAAAEAARYLRRVMPHNRSDREAGLDLVVRGLIGVGDIEGARTAQAELEALADLVGTTPFKAAAGLAAGRVSLAEGDIDKARRRLEDSVDLYRQSGATYELARARIELARALNAAGQVEGSLQEAQGRSIFSSNSGGTRTLGHARSSVRSRSGWKSRRTRRLTVREIEVLRLVAGGSIMRRSPKNFL